MRDRLPDDAPESMGRQQHVFVGRNAEMAELLAGLQDAIGGRGRLFLIAGEPGIGKTTLASELAPRAAKRGVRVLWGRCWEGGGAPPYWPWTQLLRPLMDNRGVSPDPEIGRIVEELARLFPDFDEEASGGGRLPAQSSVARFRLFAAVADLLRRASSAQPLLLILDDLHAADPASLLLLRFVAKDLRDLPLMVVATHRESDARRGADVAEALGELVREGPSLRLRGLDPAEVQQLVSHLTRIEASEEELSRIDEATGGNPLFIRELVSLAGTRGRPLWRGAPEVSAGIRAVIHQRLAELDEDAIHVLSVASVAGQDFELYVVEQVSSLGLSTILESLARAERAGLVTRVPGAFASFRFSHGLVREVLYDDLPVSVRRELHGKVAAAIEALYGDDPASYLTRLAYHYGEIATPEGAAKVAEYARRAGDQAMASYAYEEAAGQYRRALAALRVAGPDETLHCDLLLRLGGALARAGDYQEAKGSFLRAAEIARRLQAPEQLARAALGFGEPQVEGGLVDQQLLGLLQEALDWLDPDDSDLRARLLARFSLELTFSDDARLREEVRDTLSRQALEMARRLGDPSALAIACRARWMAVWGPDGLEERVGLSEEILRLARETGDREMELIGRARRITCSMESGEMEALGADMAVHAGLAGELRMPYHEWTAATLRAGRLLMDGSFGAPEKLIKEASSLLPGRPNARLAYLNQITLIRWEQGRLGELREEWRGVSERFPQAGFAGVWLGLPVPRPSGDRDGPMG